MEKKNYEAPSVRFEGLIDEDILTVSTEIPEDWFGDYESDWENNIQ